jgi:hypothetical protein
MYGRDSLADSHTQNLPGRCGGSNWRIGLPAAVSERHPHREPRRSTAPCPLTDAETANPPLRFLLLRLKKSPKNLRLRRSSVFSQPVPPPPPAHCQSLPSQLYDTPQSAVWWAGKDGDHSSPPVNRMADSETPRISGGMPEDSTLDCISQCILRGPGHFSVRLVPAPSVTYYLSDYPAIARIRLPRVHP